MTGDRAAVRADRLEVLLCDADGTLFPSEEPAFEASAGVTNRLLAEIGAPERFTARQLRLATSGSNFRATAVDLARSAGIALGAEVLERWVQEERRCVSAHLAAVLDSDPRVIAPLRRLRERFGLALVTSSAAARIDACLRVAGLAEFFPPDRCFSAEDSLARPESKPSPAVYRHAGEQLGVAGDRALAIEDTAPGARSAVGAGFPAVGFVMFVAPEERAERMAELWDAGVHDIVASWTELEALLSPVSAQTAVVP